MRLFIGFVLAGVAAGCSYPSTQMEPAAAYGARERPTVSSAPAYEAGTNYRLTYSPDGATRFVCADGYSESAAHVTPGATPAC